MPLKRFFACFIYAFMLISLLPLTAARAAQAELEITVTPVPAVLDGAGQVTLDVKIRVLSGDAYSAIYDVGIYRDGQELCNIPSISAGEVVQQKLNAPVSISEQELGMPIELRCFYRDFDNENRTKSVMFTVRANKHAAVTLSRVVTPPDAQVGAAVSIAYTVKNTGFDTLRDVRLYDEAVSAAEPIFIWRTLEAGEGAATSSALVAQAGAQSKPYVTYVSDGVSERVELPAQPLHAAVDKLTVTLKADKALINAGEVVALTCTLINEGTLTYRDITIKAEGLGDNIPGVAVLEPGGQFVSPQKIAPVSTATYTLVATAKTADGKVITASSEPLVITVANSIPQTPVTLDLRIAAVPAVTELQQPDDVTVDITISNKSAFLLRDIVIKEESLGEIDKMDTLPVGVDKVIKPKVPVKAATTLKFFVEARTEQGSLVVINAAPVTIGMKDEALSPTPYVWADPTPEAQSTPPPTENVIAPMNSGATGILLAVLVLIGVLIVICVIALIILWIRDRRRYDGPPEPPYYDDDDDDGGYGEDINGDDERQYSDSQPTRAKEAPTRYDDRTRAVRKRK